MANWPPAKVVVLSNEPTATDYGEIISPSEAYRVVMRIGEDALQRAEAERESEAQFLAELLQNESM